MTTIQVVGNHEYADAFPMASDEELEELAASIAAVGLIHPIVLTPKGEVLDGRNRLAACEKAGVEPTFETRDGDDDDYKEFVIGANTTGRRESMTVQMAAAAKALVLGHERRKNGAWNNPGGRGKKRVGINTGISPTERVELSHAGVVLDELGPAHLIEVRDGLESLKDKYDEAKRIKDKREQTEARKVEAAQKAEEREQRAREFFENDAAAREWLNSKPEGTFGNMRAAFAAIQEEREEIRQAELARVEAERRRLQEHRDSIQRTKSRLEAWLDTYTVAWDMRTNEYRDEILNALETRNRNRFLTIEKETTWPTEII